MKFNKCRLNQVRSHKVLAEMLGISLTELRMFSKKISSHYEEFYVYKNKKPRLVEDPSPALKGIHHRLKAIFSDIPLPSYVYSGRKKVSYKDNAKAHLENRYACTFDIEKFFPRCSRDLLENFFYHDMKMSQDVARTMSYLVSYKNHIPTGSPISQVLAYWVNYRVFERIYQTAQKRGFTFSLYVDDMTFSSDSQKFNRGFHLYVNFLLKKNALNLSKSKVQYYSTPGPKIITGCVVDSLNRQIKAPNKLKRKVFTEIDRYDGDITKLSKSGMRSTYGRVNAIRYIEGAVMPNLKVQIEKRLI